MTTHSTVGVDDDLAAGQAGVAHRSTDDETSSGIDVIFGIGVEQVGRNRGLDHVLHYVSAQRVVGNGFGVLRRDDNGIHANRLVIFVVLHRDL